VDFPPRARVLEIGCGTGAVTRELALRPRVAQVTGVDSSPVLLERARTYGGHMKNLFFELGDGRALQFDQESFDVVVLHRTLSHVPQPEGILVEARRVLRTGGSLAIFDADYASLTFASGPCDPFHACAEAAVSVIAYDPWLIRRLPYLLNLAGFAPGHARGFNYLSWPDPSYLLAILDQGAKALLVSGRIDAAGEESLKAEARRRIQEGTFYSGISYVSVITAKVQPQPLSA